MKKGVIPMLEKRTYMVAKFDVTHLSEDERGQLAFEVAVQAEESDYVGLDETGAWTGHRGVPEPEIEWAEAEAESDEDEGPGIDYDERLDWYVGKVGGSVSIPFSTYYEARAAILGIELLDPSGVHEGMYFIDPPSTEITGPGEGAIYSNTVQRQVEHWASRRAPEPAPTKPDGRPMPEGGSKEGVTLALLPFLREVEAAWYYETKGELDLIEDPDPQTVSMVLDLRLLALENVQLDQGGQYDRWGNEVDDDSKITEADIASRVARALNIVFFGAPR